MQKPNVTQPVTFSTLLPLATPIVRRFETWLPDPSGHYLRRSEDFCESFGTLGPGAATERIKRGEGVLGRALTSGTPGVSAAAATEPGGTGNAARAANLNEMVVIPVLQQGAVVALVAWYF